MLDAEGSAIGLDREPTRPFYSPDLQPLLQSLLKTLADIDFEYEQDRERLLNSVGDATVRDSLLKMLGERHRERREPYIRHLAVLQEQIITLARCG